MKRLWQTLLAIAGGAILLLGFTEANKHWEIAGNVSLPLLAGALAVVFLIFQWRKNDKSNPKHKL